MANDDLKAKYQHVHQSDRIKAMCKAIGNSTHTQITTQVKRNGTVYFEVVGHRVKGAVEQILNEFCKVFCYTFSTIWVLNPLAFTSL